MLHCLKKFNCYRRREKNYHKIVNYDYVRGTHSSLNFLKENLSQYFKMLGKQEFTVDEERHKKTHN